MRRTRHGLRRASIIAAAVLLLWTTRIDALPPSPSATLPEVDGADYLIQIGDQLDIKFFYNPTLNEQITVRPDGRISLQLIEEVSVAGMTPAALTKELVKRYSVELRQPQVTVIVRGFGAQRVFVDGEVGRPGMVSILGETSLLQAIAQAGGLKDTARDSEIIVIRRGEGTAPVARQLNLKKARDGSDAGQDISLAPFDIVFVPRSRMSNVNVWMDQYIRQNIPIPFGLQYGLVK